MEKLNGTSMDIVQDNIEKLKEIFPEVFSEGKIDFKTLQQLLGKEIDVEQERYSFNWHGKSNARRIAQEPSTGTLLPSKEDSKDWGKTDNLYIEGDNLEVLKLLQKSYHGKIKMIYIDPPYNTGKDFVYPDNFKDNLKNYLEITGQVGEEGHKLSTNSDSSGRYHSEWLNMMYPRLKLARNLLIDDGTIFISIDDNEVTNLKKICDEIYGEENFVGKLIWKRRTSSGMTDNKLSIDHEYIIIYKKIKFSSFKGIEKTYSNYKNPNNDPRGDWMLDNLTVGMTAAMRPNQYYDLIDPETGDVYPCNPNRVWSYIPESMNKLIKENRIYFPKDLSKKPMLKRYKNDLKDSYNPFSSLLTDVGLNTEATKVIQELFEGKFFDYSKPVSLLKSLITQVASHNDIILDFFSGSATTAHAVMQLNAEDGGNRKYIMVQLPEPTPENSEAFKAGYKNICEIGKERIRRAGDKIKSDETLAIENRKKLDTGFKVFKLDTSNIKEWDSETEDLRQMILDSVDNIKSDRTTLDVLYEILLKYGLDLNVPIAENEHFYSIGGGTLLVNLDKKITLEVIDSMCEEYKMLLEADEEHKTTVILRDSSFHNDIDKTNAIQRLKQAGIKEIRSI